jgi:hypothetical protein
MTIGEIKKLLDRGDYIKIARIAGYKNVRAGSHYVYDVMNGRRNSNKGKGKKILEAAELIASQNFVAGKTNQQE